MIRVLQVAAAAAIMTLSAAALAAPRYTISQEEIAAAVREAGMPVTPAQVVPLAEVVSSVARPQLRVRSIEPGSGGQTVLRMECVRSSDCLPFVAALRTDHHTSSPADSPAFPLTLAAHTPAADRPAIRSGAAVVLYLDSGRVHIRIPAICLENGTTGQTVRATSPDHRQTYVATVLDSSSLKGTF